MEETLHGLKEKYDKLLADNAKSLENMNEEKAFQFLKYENFQLRTELKRINDFISHLVELRKNCIFMNYNKKI